MTAATRGRVSVISGVPIMSISFPLTTLLNRNVQTQFASQLRPNCVTTQSVLGSRQLGTLTSGLRDPGVTRIDSHKTQSWNSLYASEAGAMIRLRQSQTKRLRISRPITIVDCSPRPLASPKLKCSKNERKAGFSHRVQVNGS